VRRLFTTPADKQRASKSVVAVVATAAVAVLTAGCGGGVQSLSIPSPPSSVTTNASVQPTTPPDLAAVRERAVPGATTTTAPRMGPGPATIDGTVLGPAGPVAGAVVQAQRVVGNQTAATQASSRPDGSFSIANLLGGIYRVRAWQSPTLAMTDPQVIFVSGPVTLTLQVTSFAGTTVTTAMNPNPVLIGYPANLVVQVYQPTVGPDGIVRPVPAAGQSVALDAGATWAVDTANPQTTGADGTALFQLTCQTPGQSAIVATVGSAPSAVSQTATCITPPPSTTTSTTTPGATTVTSAPPFAVPGT
jgi:hypothetical protein